LVSENLDLLTFYDASPNIYENTVAKYLATAGSNLDFVFSLTSSRNEITQESRIIIVFPIYYLPSLSKDGAVACYYNDQ
jgi:hypothetical protein